MDWQQFFKRAARTIIYRVRAKLRGKAKAEAIAKDRARRAEKRERSLARKAHAKTRAGQRGELNLADYFPAGSSSKVRRGRRDGERGIAMAKRGGRTQRIIGKPLNIPCNNARTRKLRGLPCKLAHIDQWKP